ncbi:MAG: hypothetical protein WA979_05995 [Pacificimonas sp.]
MAFTIDTAIVLYCAIAFVLGLILGWLLFRGAGKRAALQEELTEAEVALAAAEERNAALERDIASTRDQIKPLADEVDRLRVMKTRNPEVAASAAPVAPRETAAAPVEKLPAFMDAAPPKPDDLQLLKGVGPKMAVLLNDMGVYMFAQVADFTPQDVKMVDAKLGTFKGRIERDQLIEQAKLLAAGRVTEYEARFGKLGTPG